MPLQFVYENIMKFTVIVFQQRNQLGVLQRTRNPDGKWQ